MTRLLLAGLILASCAETASAQAHITAAVMAPNGRTVLTGSQRGITAWTWPDLKRAADLPTQLLQVHDLAFSPDQKLLMAVGGKPAQAGEIEFFTWPSRELVGHHRLGDDLVYQGCWTADGQRLLLAGPRLNVTLVSGDGQVQRQVAGHSRDVVAAGLLADGFVVSGARDHTLRVWRADDLTQVQSLDNHTGAIHDVAPRPGATDPSVVASSSSDRTVRLWWPVQGRMIRFATLPSAALDLAWTPDGRLLLAACIDGRLRVIDPETVEIVADLEAIGGWAYAVTSTADGRKAFVGGQRGEMKVVTLPSP